MVHHSGMLASLEQPKIGKLMPSLIFILIYSTGISNQEVDKMHCIPSKKENFFVCSFYKAMTI